ncbi:MAG: FAD-dependent oxidoreductase [Oscillospiraceae bacterium]
MNADTLSYWKMTATGADYPPLKKDLETEVLIIGGGITGVTCAYCLAQKGLRSVLIEAEALCSGTTGNTTGKLTIQHDIFYSNTINKYGEEAAREYAQSQTEAVEFVRRAVERENIDCQLADSTAYVYASTKWDVETVEKEYEAAKVLGIDAEYIKEPRFPAENYGMLGFKNQAVFHSVRYVNGLAQAALAKGAEIYCGTKAVKLDNGDTKVIHCENGTVIRARHLVMATQYPFYDGPNLFYNRLYPKRAYGIAVKAKWDWPDGSYINVSDPARSIRTHLENGERILIVVGESHETGRGEKDMKKHFDNLVGFTESIAGVEQVLAKWSAQDYETPDQIPYIGRISDNSTIYAATGYRKWGLSNGTLAGIMISDLISEGNCRYESLYSRTRKDQISSLGKTLYGVTSAVKELIKSKLESTESIADLKPGEGRIINFEGKKAGIYRDENDNITIIDIMCTHMSTNLNFNTAEKTWDCPAHGGRFDTEGRLIEGPPKNDLPVYFKGKFSDLIEEKQF